jgi:hypothetical protein
MNGKILFPSHTINSHHLHSHSDVLRGLSNCAWDTNPSALKPAERLRLVHTYVTATPPEGGLGIHPDNNDWPRVESIMALHDPKYSHVWIRSVTKTIDIGDHQLEFIRGQVRAFASNTSYCPLTLPVWRGRRSLLCIPRVLHAFSHLYLGRWLHNQLLRTPLFHHFLFSSLPLVRCLCRVLAHP